jgi:hypothetical protein
MSTGLILAAAALAQAADAPTSSGATVQPAEPVANYGPSVPAPPRTPVNVAVPARKDCSPDAPDPETGAIVVCVIKSDGYRLDPDVMAASGAKRRAEHGPPLSRADHLTDTATPFSPPMGCPMGFGCVDLAAAGLTAARVAARLAQGKEVGSVFRTGDGSTEYQYYKLAKMERERAEREAEAAAYAAEVEAEDAAQSPDQGSPNGQE